MHCEYCSKSVFAANTTLGKPITVPGTGVAHTHCAQRAMTRHRIFRNLALASLHHEELNELKELVLQEVNERQGNASSSEIF